MDRRLRIVSLLVLSSVLSTAARGELTVTSDFENGSAVVDGIDQVSGTIRIHPAGDPVRGWPCWWSFKVTGIEPGRKLTIEIDRAPPPNTLSASWSQPVCATYSLDDGRTWLQTEKAVKADGRARYTATIDADHAWFAWGPVFDVDDAHELVERLAKQHPFVTTFELSKTREGRSVPGIVVRDGNASDAERYGLWLNARQHAWESGGSWVGRGFIEWLVGDDPRAVELRRKSLVYFVPVMDVDSVATGNGGKNQKPQDHNRDWTATPHFPEVAAAQRRIAELNAAGRIDVFVDLHNPAPDDGRPFFFVAPDDTLSDIGRRNLARFIAAAKAEITGPLPLSPNTRPSGAGYSPQWQAISKNWVTAHTRPHVVAVTLETTWNSAASTAEGYSTVGRQLGLALECYLRESPRP